MNHLIWGTGNVMTIHATTQKGELKQQLAKISKRPRILTFHNMAAMCRFRIFCWFCVVVRWGRRKREKKDLLVVIYGIEKFFSFAFDCVSFRDFMSFTHRLRRKQKSNKSVIENLRKIYGNNSKAFRVIYTFHLNFYARAAFGRITRYILAENVIS